MFWRKNDNETVYRQYVLAVEMADKISERREWVNKFFLTLLSVFTTLMLNKYFIESDYYVLLLIMWILLSIIWFISLLKYKRLNSAKYSVICSIEKKLPIEIYNEERNILKRTIWTKSLTSIELTVPLIFILTFIIIIAINIDFNLLLAYFQKNC